MSGRAQRVSTENQNENEDITKVQRAPKAGPANRISASRSLGRWTLLKPLARGGMGEVYLATSGDIEGAERPAVVKLIRREHAQDKSFLARFFDEARIQAQLHHPGVAQVLEASTDQSGKPYVVLEHVEGRNLSDVRSRASQLNVQLSWADAVAIAIRLGEALHHVHERTDASGKALSIVHRDLSPQNVMVGYAGDVKLIDFGTARGENRRCQTVSGIVFAKPGYVAPEVANQNQPGPQADLYALGVILWELVMGRRFLTGDPTEHLTQVATGTHNPPAVSLTNNVPLELDTVIARLTAPRLQDRFETAKEAVTALGRVLSRASSLADGERSIRGRLAHLMGRLYPSEPTRTRAEFANLVAGHRQRSERQLDVPKSPKPDAAGLKDVLPGTRYRILSELSRSSLSVVHEAEHVDLGRRVALKVLPAEHCSNPRFEAQFRREARALVQLRHDALVTLHDFGVSSDGRPFYAMELLHGETLKHTLAGGPLDWRRAVRIALDICGALASAHHRGIIHRDVKPANVFLTDSGETKLIDFGISQAEAAAPPKEGEPEAAKDDSSEQPADQDGAVCLHGTPEYMAPEQLGRETVDERADLYALASVTYEMITGYPPHSTGSSDSVMALVDAKKHERVLAPSKGGAQGTPKALDAALIKALHPQPEQRFLTATLLGQALEHCLSAPARGRRRRRRLSVAAGAVAISAMGAVAFAATDEPVRRSVLSRLSNWMNADQNAAAMLPTQHLEEQVRPDDATRADVASNTETPGEGAGGDPANPIKAGPANPTNTDPGPLEANDSVERVGGEPIIEGAEDPSVIAADSTADPGSTSNAESIGNTESIGNAGASNPESAKDKQLAQAEPSIEGEQSPPAEASPSAKDSANDTAAPPDALPAEVVTALKQAKRLTLSNRADREVALHRYRKIAEDHPKHPDVLSGWSKAAARAKWWGESLRVALRWAASDSSPDAHLHLARTQRLVGQRYGAIQTLERLLERLPEHPEAKETLARYRRR